MMRFAKTLLMSVAAAGCLTPAIAAEALAVTLTYDSSIGRAANIFQGEPITAPGTLFLMQGVAVQESTGLIYVANGRGADRIDVFDSQGNYIKAIGSTGSGPGQFDEPAALAFDPQTGNLYVGDVYNNRISIFDAEGTYLKSIAEGQFSPPSEGRIFFGPAGITFDKAGDFYIGDFSGDRIFKYTKDGQLLATIGSSGTEPGQFQGPAGVQVSPLSGNLFVTDQYNNRVQVLDPSGKVLNVFGETGSGPGQFLLPIDIEVDEAENVYVMDSINSRVQVFDRNGNYLSQFGSATAPPPRFGTTDPPFGNPLDLRPGIFNWTAGSDYKNGKLYVGDFFQGRVQILDVNRPATSVPESAPVAGLVVLGLGAALTQRSKLRRRVNAVN